MEDAVIETGGKRRTLEAGRGLAWWTQAWALFMRNPVMWLVFGVAFIVSYIVLGVIPILGGLAAALLYQVIVGGWMLSARKLESGGTLEFADLFSGFKEKLNPLLVLGAFALLAGLLLVVIVAVLGGGAVLGIGAGAAARSGGGMMAGAAVGMFSMVVALVLAFVIGMAFWLAPALVVFGNVAPLDALKASWSASLANIAAFLVYGVIWIVAGVVASIPLGLGWFVLLPLTMLGMYCSYKEIFEGEAPASVGAAAL